MSNSAEKAKELYEDMHRIIQGHTHYDMIFCMMKIVADVLFQQQTDREKRQEEAELVAKEMKGCLTCIIASMEEIEGERCSER